MTKENEKPKKRNGIENSVNMSACLSCCFYRTSQESKIYFMRYQRQAPRTQRNIVTNYYCFLTHYVKMLHILTFVYVFDFKMV